MKTGPLTGEQAFAWMMAVMASHRDTKSARVYLRREMMRHGSLYGGSASILAPVFEAAVRSDFAGFVQIIAPLPFLTQSNKSQREYWWDRL